MLKKIMFLVLVLALFSMPAIAQNAVRLDAAGNVDISMPAAVRVGYSNWYDIYNYGVTSHRLTYRPVGAPASFTLTMECSNTGSDAASSVLGTGTTVTGGAITASNTPCSRVRWHLSALSGTVTLYITYHGSFDAAGAAATVALSQSGTDNNVAFGTPQHVIVDSGGGGGTQYTNDAALTIASTIGTMALCRASAAVPTGVSADDDPALLWCLRSGALSIQPTYAGVLGLAGNGASGTGVPRVTIANDSTGILAQVTLVPNVTTVGTVSAVTAITNALPAGTNNIGKVDIPNALPTGTNNIGAVNLQYAGSAAALNTGVASATTLRVIPASDTVIQSISTSITPGTAAANLGKAEDGTPANGDTMVPSGCIVQGTLSATTSDTKYGIPKCNANSVLYFQNVFQTAADAANNATVTTNPVPVGGVYASSPTALTDGQVGYPLLDTDHRFSVNVGKINGVTPLMGNGVTGTGSTRVTIASDNTAFSVNATLAAETTKVIGTIRNVGNVGAAFDAATGAAPPANVVYVGGLTSGATGGFLSGIPVCDSTFNINIGTATTTLAVTGVSGRHVRICEIDMVTAAANNVGIISGTGATCGTGSAAIVGTTAATGYNFAANGGIATGGGLGMIKRTVATGDSVCIITSAATQLSGTISYTIY